MPESQWIYYFLHLCQEWAKQINGHSKIPNYDEKDVYRKLIELLFKLTNIYESMECLFDENIASASFIYLRRYLNRCGGFVVKDFSQLYAMASSVAVKMWDDENNFDAVQFCEDAGFVKSEYLEMEKHFLSVIDFRLYINHETANTMIRLFE